MFFCRAFTASPFLLHPEGTEAGAGDEAGAGADTGVVGEGQEASNDTSASSGEPDTETVTVDDVRRIKGALDKERELRKSLEKELKSLKTEGQNKQQTLEERLAQLENENRALALEREKDSAIKDAVKSVEKGFRVDMDKLFEMLPDLNINAENVKDVIQRAVKRATVPEVSVGKEENKQAPAGGSPEPKNILEAPPVDWSK